MARIKLYGNLRTPVDASQVEFPGSSVRSVVDALCERNPQLRQALLENGQIRPHFIITRNGHDIQLADGLDTPVAENDHISIFPPIAGGIP